MRSITFLTLIFLSFSYSINGQTCRVWPLGICTTMSNANLVKGAGFAYLEESVVTFLSPSGSEKEFEQKLEQIKTAPLKIEVCNNFLPPTLKSIGAKANTDSILHYAEIAFRRAQKANIKLIIFASGGSRSIPNGYTLIQAKKQFVSLLQKLGDLAKEYNITLCIEPLNRYETNFINTVAEGILIVKEVNHPNIKLSINYYHIKKENELLSNIETANKWIAHVHIAEMPMRTPPGVSGDDFTPLFQILSKINYKGRISIECGWSNMQQQINEAYTQLDKQMCEGYR